MITGNTRLYGVVGRPVRHSRSPALHNAWFRTHQVDAVYLALEVPDGREDRVLEALDTFGVAGANLTTPLKERFVAALPALDPSARAVGAVNLLVREADHWRGANTDAEGFCRSVEAHGVSFTGRIAAVIGTGGAARAVAAGLASRGAREVRILGRRPERAEAIAAALQDPFPGTPFSTGSITSAAIAGAEILAVATAGRASAVGDLDPRSLAPAATWIDLNYWDPDPPGMRSAAATGCTTIDGSGMLVWQAALSFEQWIGVLPDVGSVGTRAG